MTRLVLASLACGLVLTAGCASIVGDACAVGYAACGGVCIDITRDPRNCGACGHACLAGEACSAGVCGGADGSPLGSDGAVSDADAGVPLDATIDSDGGDTWDASIGTDGGGVRDGGPADDVAALDGGGATDGGSWLDAFGGLDGGAADGGVADAAVLDAGPLDCGLGELECTGRCVDVLSSPSHCGRCGLACGGSDLCQAGLCVPLCGPGLLECGGGCVDPMRDADHCGACRAACPTGVCLDGTCAEPYAGHFVVVGHDYRVGRAAMNRVVGNAVFLSPRDPVVVLAYVGGAMAASVSGTDTAIAEGAARLGRTWTRAPVASAADLPIELADADVLLVYAQHAASDVELDALGVTWAPALADFLAAGGVVVALDGASAAGGTPRLLSSAGLLTPSAIREDATGAVLRVVAPADLLAGGLPLSYRGELSTIRLVGADAPAVVGDAAGAVVLHRVVVP